MTTKLNQQGLEGNELKAGLRSTEELFVKSGKVKEVYLLNENELEFRFGKNKISAFDKTIDNEIPHKGEVLARTSAFWFKELEKAGIPTHFIELTTPDTMRVKRVDVIRDYSKLTPETKNYLIPLEFITRYYGYGSLWDRIVEKTITPEQLGFAPDHVMVLGEALPRPFFEATTKLEKTDEHLTDAEAIKMAGITQVEFEQIRELCLKIDGIMDARAKAAGLIHVDGKKEFARDKDGKLTVVDTFGNADEDRWWNAAAYALGEFVERSKEIARQYYKDIGYFKELMKVRDYNKQMEKEGKEGGIEEPPIPQLPDSLVEKISREYIRLYEDLTGEKFR